MTTRCYVEVSHKAMTKVIVNQSNNDRKITNQRRRRRRRRRIPLPSCYCSNNKITTILYLNFILLLVHHNIITPSSATFITHPLLSPPFSIITTSTTTSLPLSSSSSSSSSATHSPINNNNNNAPLLALITLPNTLTTPPNITTTLITLSHALSSSPTLLSIRCPDDPFHLRSSFVKRVVALKNRINPSVLIVVNDDVEAAMEGGADGIHLKERDGGDVGWVRRMWRERLGKKRRCVVGTSVHSVEGALDICRRRCDDDESDEDDDDNMVDYLFVGTCYTTKSHPEKGDNDLEGPCLPGDVKRALIAAAAANDNDDDGSRNESIIPSIFAIGGIDETNCREPVKNGADGVAVIRSVMEADDPKEMVDLMKRRMLGEGGVGDDEREG